MQFNVVLWKINGFKYFFLILIILLNIIRFITVKGKGVLHIPQSSWTGVSPPDFIVLYLGLWLGWMKSAWIIVPTINWALNFGYFNDEILYLVIEIQSCRLFNFYAWWRITFRGLFNFKAIMERQKLYYLTHSWKSILIKKELIVYIYIYIYIILSS